MSTNRWGVSVITFTDSGTPVNVTVFDATSRDHARGFARTVNTDGWTRHGLTQQAVILDRK